MTVEQTVIVAVVTALLTIIAQPIINYTKKWLDVEADKEKFQREYSFEQLKELYSFLYAIIAQSEYLRYFLNLTAEFDKVPFLEIRRRKVTQSLQFATMTMQSDEFEIEDAITEFKKEKIAELVLEKRKFALQELIKLASAYRFVHDHYQNETLEEERLEKFKKEELLLIAKIVKHIVKEYNRMLKDCHLSYNEKELETGIMNMDILKSQRP
ncbi:hypothetical protein P4S95_16335 [Aneurinibacillus aneurinilyticus]|uniref:hypothetical protein n=1 Tax=Aneurinibacillus aneurinilyticus TaxID=1391 RepID=UPI002E1B9AE2|nr:hypothetical protein [Aneurinibacillus aneurinilyticus]